MGNVETVMERGRWKLVNANELHFAWGSNTSGVTGVIWFPAPPKNVMVGGVRFPERRASTKPSVSFDSVGGDRVLTDYKYFIGSMDGIRHLVDSGSECVKMWFVRGGCMQSTSDYMADAGHYCLHGQRP